VLPVVLVDAAVLLLLLLLRLLFLLPQSRLHHLLGPPSWCWWS
jgi:hypothetical protein